MGLLTEYGDANLITIQGKTQRITCSAPTDPMVEITAEEGSEPEINVSQWYQVICHSTAAFAYVGMDLATATRCRNEMIENFTRQKDIWKYEANVEEEDGNNNPDWPWQNPTNPTGEEKKKVYKLGWKKEGQGTVQEAEVSMSPMGGHMWQVTVQVDCQDEVYTTKPGDVEFNYPNCMSDIR